MRQDTNDIINKNNMHTNDSVFVDFYVRIIKRMRFS